MKAFFVDRYSSTLPLQQHDVATPEPRDDEVLVQVHAAGVNLLDVKVRNGEFKQLLTYKPPFIAGHDVAGVVVRVGARVRTFKVGDEVYSRVADHRIGTFAEYIAVQENDLALKPKNLTMIEAASIPLVGLTVWQALVQIGKLSKGQKVFIQAGSGGVGTFAIQFAKHLGATVATTTSTANINMVRQLGADIIVDYKTEDFEDKLSGYDLVLHSQDSAALTKSMHVLRPGGRVVSITGPADPTFAAGLKAPWLLKQIVGLSSFVVRRRAKKLGVHFSFLFMEAQGQQLGEITKLIEAGVIRPVVDKVFPFASTNEALAYVETGRAKGKVVVQVMP